MTYGDFKDLARRTASDKVLRDKAFNIAKYHGYERGLPSMVYKFFDKKLASLTDISGKGGGFNNELNKMKNWLKNSVNQLLKYFKQETLFFI